MFTYTISSICVNVSILDDSLLEGNETFDLVLRKSDDNVILLPARSTIIIIDNDFKCKFYYTV